VRKAQIRVAAAELIAERGLAGTRVADVAQRAGTSKPAILYWFGNKDAMLADALTLRDEEFYVKASLRMEALSSGRDRLHCLLETFIFEYDYRLWMELWVRALRDPSTAETRRAFDTRWRRMISDTIRRGQDRGEFGPDDPADLAFRIAALLDGLLVQVTLDDPDVTREQVAEICIDASASWLKTSLVGCGD
jgi:AcrR family transcriptional regulator